MEYWGLRNYGESTETIWGGDEDCEHEWKIGIKKGTTGGVCKLKGAGRAITEARYTPDSEHAFCVKCGCWKGQLGLEPTWQLYVSHMVTVCQELKRILKKTGSMYIVLGDTYAGSGQGHKISEQREAYKKYSPNLNFPFIRPTTKIADYQPKCLMGIPWRVAFALMDDGWVLREKIVWHKGNPMPGSQKDRLTQTCELIFHFVKNTGKAMLWRNELTGEWRNLRPKQVYYHVETHELRDECPPKEERYAVNELGNRHLVWKPLWRGFDYYYELDAIREPHETSSLKRAGKTGVVPFNLRVRDAKRGKKGMYVEGGKVKQLQASEKEVENYVYPENPSNIIKIGRHHGSSLNEGRATHYEGQRIENNSKGKNPGDTFQTRKKPYIGNNPHRMRLQNEQFLALDPSRPMDLSHPKGKNPGDILERKEPPRPIQQPQRWERGKNVWEERFNKIGKNPGDFWTVCTKPFKGAHFAVYPEAICVNPILSSCPPNGTVLDPMCGSGTTCLVAKKLGRNYIGIEINSAYVEMARKRLSKIPEKLDKYVTEKLK